MPFQNQACPWWIWCTLRWCGKGGCHHSSRKSLIGLGEVRLNYVLPVGNGVRSGINVGHHWWLWFALHTDIYKRRDKAKSTERFFDKKGGFFKGTPTSPGRRRTWQCSSLSNISCTSTSLSREYWGTRPLRRYRQGRSAIVSNNSRVKEVIVSQKHFV